jgi:hypothetical protein
MRYAQMFYGSIQWDLKFLLLTLRVRLIFICRWWYPIFRFLRLDVSLLGELIWAIGLASASLFSTVAPNWDLSTGMKQPITNDWFPKYTMKSHNKMPTGGRIQPCKPITELVLYVSSQSQITDYLSKLWNHITRCQQEEGSSHVDQSQSLYCILEANHK